MKDSVVKTDKWVFDDEVAKCFDDMLERSIPNYETMRELVFNVGKHFVTDSGCIVDIGCSNGNAALPFVKSFPNEFLLCDVSDSMLDLCKRGFSRYENVSVLKHDLRNGIPDCNACLVLSILTVQFTPIEYRHRIINSIYKNLQEGGALIYVEKLLGYNDMVDSVLVEEYYGLKKENQYTQEQIESKRKSLEGVLVPVTESWNIDLLKNAGFKTIECFWRYLNFAGYIAVKE